MSPSLDDTQERAGWVTLRVCNLGSAPISVDAVTSVVDGVPAVAVQARVATGVGAAPMTLAPSAAAPSAAAPSAAAPSAAAPSPAAPSAAAPSAAASRTPSATTAGPASSASPRASRTPTWVSIPTGALRLQPGLTIPAAGVGLVDVLLRADTCRPPVTTLPLVLYATRDATPVAIPVGGMDLPQQLGSQACGQWPSYVVTGTPLSGVRLDLAGPPRLVADPAARTLTLSVPLVNPNDVTVTVDGLRTPSPGVSVQGTPARVDLPPLVTRTVTATLHVDDCASVFRFSSWALALDGLTTGGIATDTVAGPDGAWQDGALAEVCGRPSQTPPADSGVIASTMSTTSASGPLASLLETQDLLVQNLRNDAITITTTLGTVPGGSILGVDGQLGLPPTDMYRSPDPPSVTRLVVPAGQQAWIRVRMDGFGCGTPRTAELPPPFAVTDTAGSPVTPAYGGYGGNPTADRSDGDPGLGGPQPGQFRLFPEPGCSAGLQRLEPLPPVYLQPAPPQAVHPQSAGSFVAAGDGVSMAATAPLRVSSIVQLGPAPATLVDRTTVVDPAHPLALPSLEPALPSPADLLVTWTDASGNLERAVLTAG